MCPKILKNSNFRTLITMLQGFVFKISPPAADHFYQNVAGIFFTYVFVVENFHIPIHLVSTYRLFFNRFPSHVRIILRKS